MKLLIPLALSLAVSACPRHEELPRNFFPLPGTAQAEVPAIDQTLARDLHFKPGQAALSPEERDGLDDFVFSADGERRIHDLKVILWYPPDATDAEFALVRARVEQMIDFLRAHKIPYEIVTLESPYYEDSQGSLLAVLEP